MRYNRFRDYLSRSARDMRSRDMRNPYGSRGGYVTSDRRGRDYEYERMGDMARRGEYGGNQTDRYHTMYDYAEGRNSNQSNRQSSRDNDYYGDMNYYPIRRMGTFDYNTYGGDFGYDMARGRDRNYDMRSGRDYAEDEYKLTPTEIRKWEKELKQNGGSAFTVDQVKQVAQQHGIRFDEFTPELLTAITNMMYSDYYNPKFDTEVYVTLANDWLEDPDVDDGKTLKYYMLIVRE